MAPDLLRLAGPLARLIADKAYDTNAFRRLLAEQETEAVIPSIARRNPKIPHDAIAYRQRHKIENFFCRAKDWRRIATRYDKLARNFLAAVVLTAAIIWWI